MNQIRFAIFNTVAFVVVLAASAPVDEVKVDSYSYKSPNDQNEYSFNYKLSDGQERNEQGSLTTDPDGAENFRVWGSYKYIGNDNIEYTVFYTADENGFHPFGSHIPGSSPLTISTPIPPPAFGLPAHAIASLLG